MDEEKDRELDKTDIDDSVVMEENQAEALKKLKDRLKQAETKAKEYLDGWQRSQADFVNIRKRDEEAKMEFLKFANADMVSQLIPVLDSLNSALAHGQKEVEPIYKQFMQVLKQNGLEESDPVGELFDPRLHESVGVIKINHEEEDHKILEVIQKGYILSGKIIRPAKVKIGKYEGI